MLDRRGVEFVGQRLEHGFARGAVVGENAHLDQAVGFERGVGFLLDGRGEPAGAGDGAAKPRAAPAGKPLARDELRRQFGLDGPTLVFAGRLTAQKSLDLGIESARSAGIELVIAGDGPDRAALEGLGYARFLGPLPRGRGARALRAGDASMLSSSWENFPHRVVESLAVGTPMIATSTGGVAEVRPGRRERPGRRAG